jgi:hypothetical protein
MTLMAGQVGATASTASLGVGTQPTVRLGNMGDLIMQELHGRYYEAAYRRSMFTAAMSALIATGTTASPTTTITGAPVLYNPIGNTYNLIINKVGIALTVANVAAAAYGLATGINTGTAISGTLTALASAPKNKFLGGAAPTGVGYASASITLPTAVTLDTILGTITSAAITTSPTGVGGVFDLEGSILIPPGGYCCFWSSTAVPASSLLMSFQWEEVPV